MDERARSEAQEYRRWVTATPLQVLVELDLRSAPPLPLAELGWPADLAERAGHRPWTPAGVVRAGAQVLVAGGLLVASVLGGPGGGPVSLDLDPVTGTSRRRSPAAPLAWLRHEHVQGVQPALTFVPGGALEGLPAGLVRSAGEARYLLSTSGGRLRLDAVERRRGRWRWTGGGRLGTPAPARPAWSVPVEQVAGAAVLAFSQGPDGQGTSLLLEFADGSRLRLRGPGDEALVDAVNLVRQASTEDVPWAADPAPTQV